VAERFGIGDAIKSKAVLTRGGREAALAVAEGRAELAIVFISEAVAVKGVKLAGPLPPTLQDYSAYATAIPSSSTDPAAARAFIAALTSTAMAERWRANGFEPPK
jgi:molybdate transport system substrate-binding protein